MNAAFAMFRPLAVFLANWLAGSRLPRRMPHVSGKITSTVWTSCARAISSAARRAASSASPGTSEQLRADRPLDAGQGHAGERRRLERRGAEVLRLEVVHVLLADRLARRRSLHHHRAEEVGHALGAGLEFEAGLEPGSCVVMPTGQRPVWQWWQAPGRGADGVVVLDVHAACCSSGRSARPCRCRRRRRRARGPWRSRRRGGCRPTTTSCTLPYSADLLDGAARASQIDGDQWGCRVAPGADSGEAAGAPLHAVEHDHVAAGLGGEPDVVLDPAGPHLDEDRHLPVGRLAQLLDLDHHVVGAEEVGVPARTSAGRRRAAGRACARSSPTPSMPSSRPPVPGFAPWPIATSMRVGLAAGARGRCRSGDGVIW